MVAIEKVKKQYHNTNPEPVSVIKQKDFKFNEDAQEMQFKIFTDNIYTDKIGSIIREVTTNCLDSHREAGVDNPKNPVIVRITHENDGNSYISFIDKGVGMSPKRVDENYSEYFSTTKLNKGDGQIGGWGIGGKTPLTYQDSFEVTTVYNGIKYFYSVCKGKKAPKLILLNQIETTEPNGTVVKVMINEGDVEDFEKSALRQLYYFKNIYFEGFMNYVVNDYKIFDDPTLPFIYRGNEYSEYMHFSYDGVAYPINYDVLNLNQSDYRIPVAVKLTESDFPDGSMGVNISRENIEYNPQHNKILINKINKTVESLVKLVQAKNKSIRTFKDYFKYYEDYNVLKINDSNIVIPKTQLPKTDEILTNFKYKDLKFKNTDDVFNVFLKKSRYGVKESKNSWSKNYGWNGINLFDNYEKHHIYFNDEIQINNKLNRYLKSKSKNNRIYVLSPNNINELINNVNLYNIYNKFSMQKYDSNSDTFILKNNLTIQSAKKLIVDLYNEVVEIVKEKIPNYDKQIIPDNFKFKTSGNYGNNKINFPVKSLRTQSYDRFSINDLVKFKGGYLVYDSVSSVDQLDYFRTLYNRLHNLLDRSKSYYESHDIRLSLSNITIKTKKEKICFISVSNTNIKYLDKVSKVNKNIIHLDEYKKLFLKKYSSRISKVFSTFNNNVLYDKLGGVSEKFDVVELFKLLSIIEYKDPIIDIINSLDKDDYVIEHINKYNKFIESFERVYSKDTVDKLIPINENNDELVNNFKCSIKKVDDMFEFINIPWQWDKNTKFIEFIKKLKKHF